MKSILLAAPAVLAALLLTTGTFAAAADYRYEIVAPVVAAAPDTRVAVRLIHLPTGEAVAGAIVFQSRLVMTMHGMNGAIAKAPSDDPTVYAFSADTSMTGGWQIYLSAKVQDEMETVSGVVEFESR